MEREPSHGSAARNGPELLEEMELRFADWLRRDGATAVLEEPRLPLDPETLGEILRSLGAGDGKIPGRIAPELPPGFRPSRFRRTPEAIHRPPPPNR